MDSTIRKIKDNINNQIRYYKNKYGYIISIKDYNEFKSKIQIIKKVFLYHDFIISTNQFLIPYEKVEFYARNYKILKLGFSIKPFLSKLKRVNNLLIKDNNDTEKKKLIIIEY